MEHHQGMCDHIHRIVEEHLEKIRREGSQELVQIIDTVPIRVLWDSPEEDRYGDFFGVPLDEGESVEGALADIVLYARPLWEEADGDAKKLYEHTVITLMHELGHYLGLDHQELAERGLA